jgi:hypothetical protein
MENANPFSALMSSRTWTGCVIMIAADAQKYFTLRLQRGLITDGHVSLHPTPQLSR